MTNVSIGFVAPKGVDPLDYRDQAEFAACEAGWPKADGGGCGIGPLAGMVDLCWYELDPEVIADGVTILRELFNVQGVSVWEDDDED